jgi:hypothetical protein
VLYTVYLVVTLYMTLNITEMISRFGMLTFFSFLRKWFIYGLIFFFFILIFENIDTWLLKRQIRHLESERRDLNIRLRDLKRQLQGKDTRSEDSI